MAEQAERPSSGLITKRDSGLWRELVYRSGCPDVYFLPEYVGFFERWDDVEACLFFYKERTNMLLYPFLRRALPRLGKATKGSANYCDVSTAYGYGGPLVTIATEDPGFVDRARRSVEQLFEDIGVVSEFIRFHPLLENHKVWRTVPSTFNRNTVAIDLTLSTEEFWEGMKSNTRRKIRQSLERNLELDISRSPNVFAQFWRLYEATMERVHADRAYRFTLEYVLNFGETMGENAVVCTIQQRDRPAAAGIFLHSGPFLHYHLGGSDAELLRMRPNDRMFFEMARWGKANLARAFHLGGGYRSNDSLFDFKAGFSKDVLDFCVGRVVHDSHMYDALTKARLSKGEAPPAPGFFPAYRG
jgi:hypothetical protein